LALSNIRLFHDIDTVDDVTLACDPPAEPACPVTNVLLPRRSLILRVLGTHAVITGVYGSPHFVNAMAVVRHTLSAVAQWRLEMFSDPAMTNSIYDSGELSALPVKALGDLVLGVDALGSNIYEGWEFRHGTFWFAPVQAWAWRLTISDVGSDHIDISRIIVGAAFSPTYNADYGLNLQWTDPSKQQRTEAGSLVTDKRAKYRRVDFNLSYMPPEDKRTLLDLQRRMGLSADLFISIYPDDPSEIDTRDGEFHCKFVDTSGFKHATFNTHTKAISCEEA
jgi:hypothetical protein